MHLYSIVLKLKFIQIYEMYNQNFKEACLQCDLLHGVYELCDFNLHYLQEKVKSCYSVLDKEFDFNERYKCNNNTVLSVYFEST